MISVVIYGRNDSHGYNLHKRAAISLNTMAEVLTEPGDEIIFTDYNTPNEFPTFPEAIADTLTERCKQLLRVLRVRPDQHNKSGGLNTHLDAIEPVARNVAVRRSNDENRWILSTNTDMILIPKGGLSLSKNVANLPNGYFVAPRYELPETVWEGFPRSQPMEIIQTLPKLAKKIHIEEIVYSQNLFDAPGDFQLIERDALFLLRGFDERMIYGWHVDSNIARRLELHHGRISDGSFLLDGYHCDHTRQISKMHRSGVRKNNLTEFVNNLTKTNIICGVSDWGLQGDEIEEISLLKRSSSNFCSIITSVLPETQIVPYEVDISPDSVASPSWPGPVDSRHVLPYLYDLFFNIKPNSQVIWAGLKDDLYQKITSCMERTELNITFCSIQDFWPKVLKSDIIWIMLFSTVALIEL